MSVLGLVMISGYTLFIPMTLHGNRTRWIALNIAIFASLFNNFGTVVSSVTFSDFAMYMLLLICLIDAIKGTRVRINKKSAIAVFILLCVVGVGLIYLISPIKKPEVLLMQTNIDQAYSGVGYPVEARWTYANWEALKRFLAFIIVLILCKDYLSQKCHVASLMQNVYKAYAVFFCFATLEFLINNFVSPTIIRDVVLKIIGNYDPAKTFYPRNRLGYYGFSCLYSEESYISMMLPFFGIVYVKGVNNLREMCVFLWGSLVLLMSGCTTGLLLFLFPLLILIKILFQRIPRRQRTAKKLWVRLAVIGCFLVGLGIAISQRELVEEFASAAIEKLNIMLLGAQFVDTSEIMSADIRNFGNSIAMNAFTKSPFFGVGIGTTRGYGVITGMLATFGVLGIVAYLSFFHTLVGLSIKGKKLLFLIIIGYFTSVLSVPFVYSLMMVPIFLLFSRQYQGPSSRSGYVQS